MISDSRSMTPSLSGDKPPSSLDTFIIPHRLICTYYPKLNRHACPAPPRHSPYWCDRNRGWENVPFAAGRPIRSAGIIGWHQKVVTRQPLSLDIRRWKKQKNELMLMLSLLLLGTIHYNAPLHTIHTDRSLCPWIRFLGIIQLPRTLESCTLMISRPLIGWPSLIAPHGLIAHYPTEPSRLPPCLPSVQRLRLRLKISAPSSHFTERLAVRHCDTTTPLLKPDFFFFFHNNLSFSILVSGFR